MKEHHIDSDTAGNQLIDRLVKLTEELNPNVFRSDPRNVQRELRQGRDIQAFIDRQSSDGAGYMIDVVSRSFAASLSHVQARRCQPGLGGFRKMFAPVRYKGNLVWKAGEERDHVFSADDLSHFVDHELDRLPSNTAVLGSTSQHYADGIAYNYTPLTPLALSWKVEVPDHEDRFKGGVAVSLAIMGIRIRRSGGALHMMLLIKLIEESDVIAASLVKALGVDIAAEDMSAAFTVALDDNRNIENWSFVMFPDFCPSAAAGFSSREEDWWLVEDERFRSFGFCADLLIESLISIAFDMTLVGSYFAFRKEHVVLEQTSGGRRVGQSGDARTNRQGSQRNARHRYRMVSALRVVRPDRETNGDAGHDRGKRGYTKPSFAVELDGYWRRLRTGSIGKGPNGEPVEGRTFVRGHTRYKDRPKCDRVVLVKQPVAPHLGAPGTGIAPSAGDE